MNAPRLLFVFALAFALGVVGTVATQHYRHDRISEVAANDGEQRTTHDQAGDSPNQSDSSDDADAADDQSTWPENGPTPEQVLYAQPRMLRDAVAKLTPRAPDKVNLYFVAFAGDGEEKVFRNEAEYADQLLSRRFGTTGHDLLLINNPATLSQNPLASLSNLDDALQAVAERMDRNEDVLLLFLTSHGSKEHTLYVSMDPLPLDQIAPDDLAGALRKSGIRHKVVVISACYSGGFIDSLKDQTTMVITAARADRASFGCGTGSDITDFGRAFFVEGLNDNDSFTGAFTEARRLIDAWETRDDEDHSDPQMVSTPQIEAKLKTWRNGLTLGPPVPFVPVSTPQENNSLTAAR
jgi:hypothetical protein